jgi:hypothetical protein
MTVMIAVFRGSSALLYFPRKEEHLLFSHCLFFLILWRKGSLRDTE